MSLPKVESSVQKAAGNQTDLRSICVRHVKTACERLASIPLPYINYIALTRRFLGLNPLACYQIYNEKVK